LMAWREGGTMLGSVVATLQAGGLSQVVVVTGHQRGAVEASLRGLGAASAAPPDFAHNPDYAPSAMARSLQIGLDSLPANCTAALVMLADQPHVPQDVVERLVQRWRETQALVVAPYFRGQRGHPLLFDRAVWPALHSLPPSANPRQIFETLTRIERVGIDSDAIIRDIDTPDDYAREQDAGTG
jgi:molybdenum cofactor cytidylyltransferase